jgi:hypothetical protein
VVFSSHVVAELERIASYLTARPQIDRSQGTGRELTSEQCLHSPGCGTGVPIRDLWQRRTEAQRCPSGGALAVLEDPGWMLRPQKLDFLTQGAGILDYDGRDGLRLAIRHAVAPAEAA